MEHRGPATFDDVACSVALNPLIVLVPLQRLAAGGREVQRGRPVFVTQSSVRPACRHLAAELCFGESGAKRAGDDVLYEYVQCAIEGSNRLDVSRSCSALERTQFHELDGVGRNEEDRTRRTRSV